MESSYPTNIYFFNVNERNTRKSCEVCSLLTIKTPERRQLASFCCLYCEVWAHFTTFSSASIVNLEQGNVNWVLSINCPLLTYFIIEKKLTAKFPVNDFYKTYLVLLIEKINEKTFQGVYIPFSVNVPT